MTNKVTGWLWALFFWLIFILIGYGLLGEVDSTLRLLLAVLFLPSLCLFCLIFLSLWYFGFDYLPRKLLRIQQGPPWQTPRQLNPFGCEQTQQDFQALMLRLDVVEENRKDRMTYYIDRYTQQKWIGQYVEQGFGSGEILTPAPDKVS